MASWPAWLWLVMGLGLMLLEIALPTFTAFWFGVAAVIVALLTWLMPLTLTAQILIWLIGACLLCVAWFKWLKPRMSPRNITSELGRESIIGQVGLLTQAPMAQQAGRIRFSMPLLGSAEWRCRSLQSMQAGDRAQVIDVIGNELLVAPAGTPI